MILNTIILIKSLQNCFTRLFVIAFVVVGITSAAKAQSIERTGRVAFELAPFRLESLTLKGDADTVDLTDIQVGLGVTNFGIHLGYGFNEVGMIGARFLIAYLNSSAESNGDKSERSLTSFYLLPNLRYVFSPDSSVRAAIGLNAGYFSNTVETDVEPSVTTSGVTTGPSFDVHVFFDPALSLDFGLLALYEIGTSEAEGSSMGPKVSGFYLGAFIGSSFWIGGRLANDRDRRHGEGEIDRTAGLHLSARRSTSSAYRDFDRQRALHVVRAKFTLSQAALRLTSAPQLNIDTIDFRFINRQQGVSIEKCQQMTLLINGQPVSSDNQNTVFSDDHITISGRHRFEIFKPLSRKYSSFGIEACGRTIRLSADDMKTLRKFFVLVSQVATDVQKGRIPNRAPPVSSATEPTEAEQSKVTEPSEKRATDEVPCERNVSDISEANVSREGKENEAREANSSREEKVSDTPK